MLELLPKELDLYCGSRDLLNRLRIHLNCAKMLIGWRTGVVREGRLSTILIVDKEFLDVGFLDAQLAIWDRQ